jgi:outer membrane protein
MKNFRYTLVFTIALTSCFAARAVHADEAGSWFIRGGPAFVDFHASGTVFVNGEQLPCAGATVRHNTSFAFETGYFLTPNWSVALTLGAPPTAKVYGTGALEGAGKLAEATYGRRCLRCSTTFPYAAGFSRTWAWASTTP